MMVALALVLAGELVDELFPVRGGREVQLAAQLSAAVEITVPRYG